MARARQKQVHRTGANPGKRLDDRPSTAPWALTETERKEALRYNRSTMHDVKVTWRGVTQMIRVRDTSVALSDEHIALGGVQFGTEARRGILEHRVKTPAGHKEVNESKNGRITMGGRATTDPMGHVWSPPPPVLTFLRVKGAAELWARPIVPVRLEGPAPTPTSAPATAAPAEDKFRRTPGRPEDPHSREARMRHFAELVFIGGP